MTLLDKLQAHKGGLIQLKPQLYWYGSRSYDNNPGRICLILDAAAARVRPTATGINSVSATSPAIRRFASSTICSAAAFLLINGRAHWVWVVEADVELLVNDPPTN